MFRHYATYRKPKKFEKNLKSSEIFFPIFPQAGTVEEIPCEQFRYFGRYFQKIEAFFC